MREPLNKSKTFSKKLFFLTLARLCFISFQAHVESPRIVPSEIYYILRDCTL